MSRRAFAYLRVSSIGQVDGDGFERQRAMIQQYADAHDIRIEKEYQEPITGTVGIEHRKALMQLTVDAERLGIRLMLVERPDRLARDTLEALLILKKLQEQKIKVIAAEGGLAMTPDEMTDPTSKLMVQLMSMLAEYEKSSLVHKMRVARERVRRKTGRCEGQKPFGHYPREQMALGRLVELQQAGLNHQQIADRLNEEKVPTRRGTRWNRGTIYKILTRLRQEGELDVQKT